jgi:periplasmic copper chaperone A
LIIQFWSWHMTIQRHMAYGALGLAFVLLLSSVVAGAFADAAADTKHTHSKQLAGVHLQGAWARFSPIAGRPAAAYMTIHGSATADRLIAASSPVAGRVEIHDHIREGDVMRMVKLTGVDVPADGEVMFKPGGLHFMLFDVKSAPKPGTMFPLTLMFEKAGKQLVQTKALTLGQAAPAAADTNPHSGH